MQAGPHTRSPAAVGGTSTVQQRVAGGWLVAACRRKTLQPNLESKFSCFAHLRRPHDLHACCAVLLQHTNKYMFDVQCCGMTGSQQCSIRGAATVQGTLYCELHVPQDGVFLYATLSRAYSNSFFYLRQPDAVLYINRTSKVMEQSSKSSLNAAWYFLVTCINTVH